MGMQCWCQTQESGYSLVHPETMFDGTNLFITVYNFMLIPGLGEKTDECALMSRGQLEIAQCN